MAGDISAPNCGTDLFYSNAEMLPEIIDIQSATYDDPGAVSGASAHSGRRTDQMDGARSRAAGVRALSATREILCEITKELTSASGHDQPVNASP